MPLTGDKRREYARRYYHEVEKKNPAMARRRSELRQQTRDRLMAVVRERRRASTCARCGETRPATLDFHHPDGAAKEGDIATLVRLGASVARITAEMDKCEVLCSNCHRQEHFGHLY